MKAQIANKKNQNASDIECIDVFDIDDEGLIEGDVSTGKVISSFNFEMDGDSSENKASTNQNPFHEKTDEESTIQNQTYTTSSRGLTPPINGEYYTVKRSYAMRPSTVRKLNALKAEHPDVNVLFNTIVDMAISHYYDYIFNENGTFGMQEEKNKTS